MVQVFHHGRTPSCGSGCTSLPPVFGERSFHYPREFLGQHVVNNLILPARVLPQYRFLPAFACLIGMTTLLMGHGDEKPCPQRTALSFLFGRPLQLADGIFAAPGAIESSSQVFAETPLRISLAHALREVDQFFRVDAAVRSEAGRVY